MDRLGELVPSQQLLAFLENVETACSKIMVLEEWFPRMERANFGSSWGKFDSPRLIQSNVTGELEVIASFAPGQVLYFKRVSGQ